jgi:hypothetical protein
MQQADLRFFIEQPEIGVLRTGSLNISAVNFLHDG